MSRFVSHRPLLVNGRPQRRKGERSYEQSQLEQRPGREQTDRAEGQAESGRLQMSQTTGVFPALSDNVKKAGGGKRKPKRK